MSAHGSVYVLVTTAADVTTGEQTNIGLIVFDGEGRYHSHRFAPLERAIRRGDWPATDDGAWLDEFARDHDRIGAVRRRRETTGHAMSSLQLSEPHASTLTPEQLLAELYPKLVKEDFPSAVAAHFRLPT